MNPTHCRACGRIWHRRSEVHCARCCEHFVGWGAFDAHLVRGHRDPSCVRSLVRRADGVWAQKAVTTPVDRLNSRANLNRGAKYSETVPT